MDKNKFSEHIRVRSELTHQLMPLVMAWKAGSKVSTQKILLVPTIRIGQLFFYHPQASIIEIIDSKWYPFENEWVGHHAYAYLLENFERVKCCVGEMWLAERINNNEMHSIE